MRRSVCFMAAIAMCWTAATVAQSDNETPIAHIELPIVDEDYDELFRRFMESVRHTPATTDSALGVSWMTDLALDLKARRVNDIVTVRVVENVSGAGAADSALAKSGAGLAALPGFFGLEGYVPSAIDPTRLVDSMSDTDFEGGGATNRTGALSAILTARVAAVLPTGDLLLEGVREVEINGDRQMLLLTGIVRPEDIGPNNVVLSPVIGQLRIRYFGEGLLKDTLKPGWITRMLNKIF